MLYIICRKDISQKSASNKLDAPAILAYLKKDEM
jgi:hypothetical protein